MPVVFSTDPTNLVDPTAVTRFGHDLTDAVGDHLRDAIKERTPISTSLHGVAKPIDPGDAFARGRYDPLTLRERMPGTLWASIQRGERHGYRGAYGRGWEIRVGTDDDIAPFVENDTRAHEIRPTPEHTAAALAASRGKKHAALQFFFMGVVSYYRHVMHPGTHGAHMFARGAAWTEGELGEIARPYVDRFCEDVTRHAFGFGPGASLQRLAH